MGLLTRSLKPSHLKLKRWPEDRLTPQALDGNGFPYTYSKLPLSAGVCGLISYRIIRVQAPARAIPNHTLTGNEVGK
jgi:hypothetical protein